jgi:imidazolonepropionase-like amidohydrolase
MKRSSVVASVLILCAIAVSCAVEDEPRSTGADSGGVFAFVDVNVIPMDRERMLEHQTVVVVEGRIEAIGDAASIEIPTGATRIDGSGRYLIPALSDMHAHLEGEAWNVMFPPEQQFAPESLNFERLLFPYLANGVATVQVLSALPEHVEIRERIATGELLGPRLVLARMIDGPDRAWPPPISTWVSTPEEARQAVLDSEAVGYDSIKVYSFLDRASYEAIMTTANEIGMHVGGHFPLAVSLDKALTAGQHLIAHSEEVTRHAEGDYSSEKIDGLARKIADSGTWMTPTLTTSRHVLAVLDDFDGELARPEVRYLHPMDLGIWSFINTNLYQPMPQEHRDFIRDAYHRFQRPLTLALAEADARLMTGTDALIPSNVPGFSIHDELAEFVDVGISPYQALRSSTTEPLAFLGELDQAGTIEVGKRADLVLLEGNPLLDIAVTRNIAGVMIQRRWIERRDLDAGLEELAALYEAKE